MKKIPTLFERDPDNRTLVTDRVTPGCEWVTAGEGVATRKWDGTCVMYDGQWWARREVKPGKTPPDGWVEVDHDPVTGKRVGWEPIAQSSFYGPAQNAIALMELFGGVIGLAPPHGTYELIGPKVNGNPENVTQHRLERHATATVWGDFPRDHDGIRDWLTSPEFGWEGVVFHHPDGRMAKIKIRDFGASR